MDYCVGCGYLLGGGDFVGWYVVYVVGVGFCCIGWLCVVVGCVVDLCGGVFYW